jgi:aminopeptidase N
VSARPLAAGLAALLAAGAAPAQLEPAPREPDVLRYVARVEPNIAVGLVKGIVTIRLDTTSDDAAPLAFDAGDLEIDSVREDGDAVPFVKLEAGSS